ncbi:MAG: TetR/AcrR family transcriptional regulator, partial [Ilumatobacteraceae bacterium]
MGGKSRATATIVDAETAAVAVDARTTRRASDSARTTILTAAIQILGRHGAGAFTVRAVAAAAGCSTTGVYTWFGSKNGLVEAIYIDGFERFGIALSAAESAAAPGELLNDLGAAYRRWALANSTHYAVMFSNPVADFRPSAQACAASLVTFETLVRAVAAAAAAGFVVGEPHHIAQHLWAGIHGYVSLELAGMGLADGASDPAFGDPAFGDPAFGDPAFGDTVFQRGNPAFGDT